jgi:hypothetical protein
MRHRGEFAGIFDLENQYFHVKLAEEAKKYFGFAWTDDEGKERFYCFNVMVYGYAAAAAVVTRLIKPIIGYLHNAGIRIAIYMDDGNVVGRSEKETEEAMKMAITAFRLSGWNIQWAKSSMQPVSEVKYLGFNINLTEFTYSAAEGKLDSVSVQIQEVKVAAAAGQGIPARTVAQVLGKLAALRVSHGSIIAIMTKNIQNRLGREVTREGWECQIFLRDRDIHELTWLQTNLRAFNGKGIREESGLDLYGSVRHYTGEHIPVDAALSGEFWNSLQEEGNSSFILAMDKTVQEVLEFSPGCEHEVFAAVQEIEAMTQIIQQQSEEMGEGQEKQWRRMFWRTDSRYCYVWIRKGVRVQAIRDRVVRLKWVELNEKIEVIPVWQPAAGPDIQAADIRSKSYASTDEWSVDRENLEEVFSQLDIRPTVDGFASSSNTVCRKFFSKWPQLHSSGVNFFAQQLQPREVYFCCPPVKDIGHTLNKLQACAHVTAILAFPLWTGHVYWGMLRQAGGYIPQISRWMVQEPAFFDSGVGTSLFTRRKGIQMWYAVFEKGRIGKETLE